MCFSSPSTVHEPAFTPSRLEQVVDLVMDLVTAHAEHGGWRETEDGLFCVADDTMVIPSGDYLDRQRSVDG